MKTQTQTQAIAQFKQKRLDSLDILRGFTLFLLVFLQPILSSLGQSIQHPLYHKFLYHFQHADWLGIHFWDMVMPLFLFMTGVAMPFSFKRYREQKDKVGVYKRILKRVVLLFLFGMIVQGNLLALDGQHLYLYTNTLQAIAVGYFIAALFQLHLSTRNQVFATLALLIIYAIPMMLHGDYSPEGNWAEKIDRLVLGRFRDGVYWTEDGAWHFAANYHYTWIWSSLTFGVTVMLGVLANKIVVTFKEIPTKVLKYLTLTGVGLILVGLLWDLKLPIIKTIWTSSMALYTGGICFLFLALFYYWIDVLGHKKGLNWLKVYGMNSILAYVLGMVVNFKCIGHSLFFGLEQYLGAYYGAWIVFVNYSILFAILYLLYKKNIFLRV